MRRSQTGLTWTRSQEEDGRSSLQPREEALMKLVQRAIAVAIVTALCAGGYAVAQGRSPTGVAPPVSGAITTGSVVHNWNARGDRTHVTQLEVTGITPADATVTAVCHGG